MKRILLAALAVSTIVLPSAPASADAVPALRLGVTDDPDSLFAGLQFQSLVSGGRSVRVYFVPGVDFGVGDDSNFWSVRGTAHFEFHFPIGRDRRTTIFPLVGLEIYYINLDLPAPLDDDRVEPGFDLGGGFKWDRFKLSIWASLDEDTDPVPDLTIAFGVLF